jgi:NTP pyrophosphatase (non-canonical NTP hydrolase)
VTSLRGIQTAAWKNKLDKGFNTTDVDREFNLLRGEVAEAYDAWRHGNTPHLAEELADVAIFLAGLAQMTGIDLEQAVAEKLAVNAARVYVRSESGALVKATS